jgi:thioredoxin reductase
MTKRRKAKNKRQTTNDEGLSMNASSHTVTSDYDFDLAVLGGGSGGYAAARTAAQAGLNVAVVEGGDEVGGLCILRGCMPSKALLYAADVIHLARQSSVWGLRIPKVEFDFEQVMARKDALIREFAEDRRRGLTGGKFKFLRAKARFTDPHTISLSTGETFTARHFVISTGSVVSPPPLAALEKTGYLTSDSALKLKRLPRSLVVLGGGSVAVEFAQFFARFDVQVTLIQRSSHLLRDFDEDTADEILKSFRHEGLKVYTGAQLADDHGLVSPGCRHHAQPNAREDHPATQETNATDPIAEEPGRELKHRVHDEVGCDQCPRLTVRDVQVCDEQGDDRWERDAVELVDAVGHGEQPHLSAVRDCNDFGERSPHYPLPRKAVVEAFRFPPVDGLDRRHQWLGRIQCGDRRPRRVQASGSNERVLTRSVLPGSGLSGSRTTGLGPHRP